MTRQQVHRKQRREKGLCGREGCKVETGDASYYCRLHSWRGEARGRTKQRAAQVSP